MTGSPARPALAAVPGEGLPGHRGPDPAHADRVWIDHRDDIYRCGLTSCLAEQGFVIAGESAGLEPRPELERVDVLLFDLGALDSVLALGSPEPTRLVGLATTVGEDVLLSALQGGVAGVLVREQLTPAALAGTLRATGGGHGSVPLEVLADLAARAASRPTPEPEPPEPTVRLLDREREVLRLLAAGAITGDIATQLAYSERTVKNIVHDVMLKLDCHTRAHAVAEAARRGLI